MNGLEVSPKVPILNIMGTEASAKHDAGELNHGDRGERISAMPGQE
jgi:hypothetical protein